MFDPNRIHRAIGVIESIDPKYGHVSVRLLHKEKKTDVVIQGFPSNFTNKFNIGDTVNIQVKFSIMCDDYTLQTISKRKVK